MTIILVTTILVTTIQEPSATGALAAYPSPGSTSSPERLEVTADRPAGTHRAYAWPMVLGLLLSWVLGGLVIGALGRLVAPGHARMGLAATMLVGIVGSFIGGAVGLAVGAGLLVRFLVAVAGSAVIVTALHGQRHLSRRQLPR